MANRARVANNGVAGECSPPASTMSVADKIASPNCIGCMAILLKIPGLSPIQCARECLAQKASVKTKRKSSPSHKKAVAIDPRQLQFEFAEA